MWPMLDTLRLAPSGHVRQRPAPRRRPSFRRRAFHLRVEALESRCLPSAGFLDPTFGTAGAGLLTPGAASVLVQPDGKILALNGATLARYNTNGGLDTSFGSGGTQTTIGAAAMALQADGKVLLVGSKELERLNSNGSPDPLFGTNGVVAESVLYDQIVVQSDGKIVVAGSNATNGGTSAFDLARYNPSGSLDSAFGRGGQVTTSSPLRYTQLEASALLLQTNGELVVLGDTDFSAPQEWLLACYKPNGSLDMSFGNNGIVTTPSAGNQIGNAWVEGAVLYPSAGTANDGKIAVVGSNAGLSSGPLLVRFNTNGSLDTTFGSNGFVPLGVNPSGVAFDAGTRFVVAGSTPGSSGDTALERLNRDGTVDATFGSGGLAAAGFAGTAARGTPVIYPATGADAADSGKIVTAGSHVARFLPAAPPSAPMFVITESSPITAGAPFSLTVTATDADGNPLTGYTGTVDFGSLDPQALVPPNYPFTPADQGVHTFTAILKTAGPQALFVADTATPGMNGRQVSLPVNPAAASTFVFAILTIGPVTRGQLMSFQVTAMDPYGNVATGYTGTVHFGSSDPLATLPADYTFTAGDGGTQSFFATFNTAGSESLTVTDTLTASITGTLTVVVGSKKGR
jgi:uncharacterized delta-60 repeat protein